MPTDEASYTSCISTTSQTRIPCLRVHVETESHGGYGLTAAKTPVQKDIQRQLDSIKFLTLPYTSFREHAVLNILSDRTKNVRSQT